MFVIKLSIIWVSWCRHYVTQFKQLGVDLYGRMSSYALYLYYDKAADGRVIKSLWNKNLISWPIRTYLHVCVCDVWCVVILSHVIDFRCRLFIRFCHPSMLVAMGRLFPPVAYQTRRIDFVTRFTIQSHTESVLYIIYILFTLTLTEIGKKGTRDITANGNEETRASGVKDRKVNAIEW